MFSISPEARTIKIPFQPTEEQNQRLTRGLLPVYHRFISGTKSAVFSWLPTSGTALFCLCKLFSSRSSALFPDDGPVEYKTRRTTGGSGRSARRSGWERAGKIGCQHNYLSRKHKSNIPSKASKKRRLNVSPEARTSEIPFKPTEEQTHRSTRGLSAVHLRFISGMRSALCSWLPSSGPTPFCLCKPFSCKACPGITFPALFPDGG